MSLYNEVRLIGYCSGRPKLITTEKGAKIATLSVYTQDTHHQSVGKDSERHRCVFLGEYAEHAYQLIDQGSHITLRGYLRYKEYTKDSIKMHSSEILVEAFALSPKEKATVMFKRNVREMLREGLIEEGED